MIQSGIEGMNCLGRTGVVPQPRAELSAPGYVRRVLGHSPPPVLDEIQLSGLPWSGAGASPTMFGLALHGSAVSSPSRRTQGRPITASGDRGVVSVPLPAVSGGASRHHASCDEGGTSPGDPRGPSTDSRRLLR